MKSLSFPAFEAALCSHSTVVNLPAVPPAHWSSAPGWGRIRRLSGILAGIIVLTGVSSTAWGQTQLTLDVLARQQAGQQIQALMADKDNRTKAQQKLDSQLIYAARESATGIILATAPKLRHGLKQEIDGRILVNLQGTVSPGLLAAIQAAGGTVLNSYPADHLIVALLPLANIEPLAARQDVLFIGPTPKASHNTGSVDSQGDTTHRAIQARANSGATGAGIKVGVLSDSIDNGSNALAAAYASGDLSSTNTFVLTIQGTNQSGIGEGEGLAMCEIVHDLAPQASLYFATGDPTESQMATNILTMAQFGCRVIIDDLTYNDESPFQDGPIAQAVNAVSAQGVVYFSSARNSGNEDNATSCTWEGDFADGGAWGGLWTGTNRSGRVLAFAPGVVENAIIPGGLGTYRADLFWSDPLGGATNDYDLYMLDSHGNVVFASNTTQNGTQNPYEHIEDTNQFGVGYFMVVTLHSGTGRFIHLDCGRGHLNTSTAGCTRGHNASGAANAFCVAATPAAGAFFLTNSPLGPYPNSFGATNRVEVFSSDGPRRMFFNPDGTAITPGNFSSTGGLVLQKPDFTAADGVATTMPTNSGLNPFYGTSAAAPHAGAIAALLLSYRPDLTPAQIRAALVNSAIAIGTPGWSRDSGAGIIMADQAIAYLNPAVAITFPTAGGELSDVAPPLILGAAAGNTAAIGAVRLALTRASDGVWYNFTSSGWGTTNFDFNNDILTASGTASWSAQLPALPDGNYVVQAQSVDVFSHASPWQSEAFSIGPPPVVTISGLTNGQPLAAFSGLAGNFQNFSPAPSVSFSIYEMDINGGSGRWWNGAGFQSSPAAPAWKRSWLR